MTDLVSRIQKVRFTVVRFRDGYDIGEVDQLLEQLEDAVRAGRPIGPMVQQANFTVGRLREVYQMEEVDRFLAELVRVGEDAASTGPSTPAPAEPSSPLASRIDRAFFTPVALREGYDMGEVDSFLDRLAAEDRAGRSIVPLVQEASFSKVRFRSAYDIGEVDRFLAELGGAPIGGAAAVMNPVSTTSSVIEERPGLFRRAFRR